MKYDSSMTQFHKNIIAALRYMLKDDSEITEKFSPEDGSPAPLRDYLKTFYSKSFDEPVSDKLRFTCTPTNFKIAFDDMLLNNKGEKELTMTWSQVTKFIRDNWDEVFKKDKPKSRPLETLVKTFDETEITCPNWLPGKTLTYLEAVNGVHFECRAFSTEFCKLDDITKFFVQHCHKPQECPYCKDSAEKQPSYIEKLQEKYPKINETDDWVWEDYCPSTLFSGKNIPDTLNALCDRNKNGCKRCWNSRCEADVTFDNTELDVFEDDYFEHYPEEESSEAAPENSEEKSEADTSPENQIIPQETSEVSSTFNYAVLSAEIGDYLKRKEQQLKNEYMNFTANCGAIFAEAQEKLAKHGFGENNGLFEKWINSIGFSKPTVYRMIDVYNFRSSQIETNGKAELFDNLSKSLQYEIAKPSAPAELVEQVLSGDITTHKDYIALKKQLEKANEQISLLHSTIEKKDGEIDGARGCIENLEKEIDKLESRPVDVAVQRDETSLAEIERLKNEFAKAQQDIIDASFKNTASEDTELISDFYETLHGSALSAIRSCADFAEKNGGKFTSRFRSLAEVINDYINEMEEF